MTTKKLTPMEALDRFIPDRVGAAERALFDRNTVNSNTMPVSDTPLRNRMITTPPPVLTPYAGTLKTR